MHKRMAGKGRVIDVSRSAAKKLGFLSHGITRVRLEDVFRHRDRD
jgi:rare lipoprotein A (peptidoglycan hydrolase)